MIAFLDGTIIICLLTSKQKVIVEACHIILYSVHQFHIQIHKLQYCMDKWIFQISYIRSCPWAFYRNNPYWIHSRLVPGQIRPRTDHLGLFWKMLSFFFSYRLTRRNWQGGHFYQCQVIKIKWNLVFWFPLHTRLKILVRKLR